MRFTPPTPSGLNGSAVRRHSALLLVGALLTTFVLVGPGRFSMQASAHDSGFASISAGAEYSLALKSDGTVWAWGSNGSGQLGDTSTTDRQTPVQVVGSGGTGTLSGVSAVSAGDFQSVALKSDGTVLAWGYNALGGLGNGTTTTTGCSCIPYPEPVVGPGGSGTLTGITAVSNAVSAGSTHSLALKGDGTVWAWGSNAFGELGNGTTTTTGCGCIPYPGQVIGVGGSGTLSGITAVSAGGGSGGGFGGGSSAALKSDGTVWTWGFNHWGELGNGLPAAVGDRGCNCIAYPGQVVGPGGAGTLSEVTAVSVGVSHDVAVKSDGTVWSWGYNAYGQLGSGATSTTGCTCIAYPGQVVGPGGAGTLTGLTAVSAGSLHSLALMGDGTVFAWGYNADGELGNGTLSSTGCQCIPHPGQVVGVGGAGTLTGVTEISAGDYHSLTLKGDGTVDAWGGNIHGELGDGTTTNRDAPVESSISGVAQPPTVAPPPPLPDVLALAPVTTSSRVGGQYSVTATLTSATTHVPLSGVTVIFSVTSGPDQGITGVQCLTTNCTTGADGTTGWGYANDGTLGIDTIVAFVDANANGVADPAEPQATASVQWTPLPRQIVFVHGIHGNFRDIQLGHGYNALLDPVRQSFGASNFTSAPFYQDLGYSDPNNTTTHPCFSQPTADTKTGPLLAHPDSLSTPTNPGTCDSAGALAYGSTALDDRLTSLATSNPGPVTIIGNSMGAAITRGWITLGGDPISHPNDAGLKTVDSVVFFQGAQQGSYLGNIQGVINALPPGASSVVDSLARTASANAGFNINRPGIFDAFALSQWYQDANAGHQIPASISTYNFYSDLTFDISFNAGFATFTGVSNFDIGDSVFRPGTDTPTDVGLNGGERFLPTGASQNHAQYGNSNHYVIDVSGNTPQVHILADPLTHGNYGGHMSDGQIMVSSCLDGSRSTPTSEIVRILHNPSGACA